ncbi:hypothetical protein QBC46DRAFT_253626 [Diplogelasinospora grovesii]|uniref:Pt repeat family protein n=1 Tax=Diplogelasinospora grovesii TaxID=303347 RepID=A0AAN6S7T3_9PEZI|nr:hypothetical protein QBC46DRAFT_253626 [Diplogelasinospora grovesii]
MAWDAQHRRPGVSSPWSRRGLILGDSFPRLEPKRSSTDLTMDQERALLSPIFEEQQNGFFSTPPLAVHVTIKFTDPVIRSIYSRSYESSPGFEPNNRICRGLLRRIEHCSEELITRKDSGATEGLRDGTDEPKPKRFEITFKIIRRGTGTWAERTFRSYQKQPLTVGATTEVILASHRMIGLYLRRHDKGFKWLDGSVRDHIPKGVETSSPSDNGPLSPLCIPRSQFIEASQSFEFVPGYSIEMSFRSRDPRRRPAIFARTIRVNSDQSAPLGLVTSEDLLWRAGQAIHQALEPKKQEYNDHVKDCGDSSCRHVDSDALDIQVKVANNLGPSYSHLYRNIKSKLTLFRDAEARDCKDFLKAIETAFVEARDSIDSKINEMHDFEFRILELRGVGWTLQQPAKFRIDSSVSYARRTVEAALERVQTGIADVIRGHNVAIHINAHKRGHLVLDKAIVARQKQGRPRELFESPKDQESALISRLKTRIQHDIDMVFKDTCSIDDIVDSEPEQSEDPLLSRAIDKVLSQTEKPDESVQQSITPVEVPTPQPPRAFSLNPRLISRSSKSDVCSLKSTTSASEDGNSVVGRGAQTPSLEGPAPLVINAPVKPAQRVFPLVPRSYSLPARVSSASTLVNEVQNALEGDKTTEAEFAGERPALVEAVSELTSTLLPPMTSSAPNGHDASSSARMMLAEERPTTPVRDPASSPSQLETPMTQEGDAQSAAQELARSKMETPKRFKDADNSGEVTKGDLQDMLSGTRSPDADEYSTAPSTPALSSGGDSSPRHSILITPTCVRTLSGTRDPIMRELEHEFDTDELGANIGAELATAAPIVKGKEDDSRHPEVVIPIGPSSARLSPAPEIIAESELSVDEADMGSRQMKSRKGKEAPSEPAATEDPIAAENELPFKSCIASPLSEVDSGQNDRAELELAANGDKGLATPDFPTAESGLSEPNEEAAEASMSPKFTSETRSAPEKEVAVDAGVVEGPELADATDIHGVTEAGAEEIEVGHDIATAPEVSNEGQVKDAPATGAEAEPESSYLELTSKSTPQAAAEDGDASGPADSPSVDAGPEPTVQAHGGSGIGGSPEVIAEAQVIPGSDPTEYPAVSLDAEPEAHAPEVTCRPHAEACPICIEDRVPAADGAEPKPEVSNLGISDEVSAKTPEVVTEGDHDAARSEAPSDDAGAEADPMDLDTPFAIDANGSELSDAFESARTSPEGEASDTEAPEYDTEGAPGADTDAEAETSTARVSDAPAAEKSDLDEVNAAASTDPEVEALNAELSDDAIAEAAEGPDTDRNGTPATELSNAEAGTKFDDSDYEILDTSSDSVVDDLTSTDADAEPEHVEFKSSGEDIPAAAIPSVEDETTPPTLSIDDDSNISEAVIDNKDVTGGPPVVWTSDVSEVKHAGPAPADFLPSTASTGLSAFNPALLDAFDPVHVSARSSTSSIRDLTVSGRGSVEDVVPFMDEEATRPSTSCSRPQTAGYLGLRETRRVKVGLRGALGDSRRLSLPLQYMLDEEALAAAGTRSTPSSVAGDKPRKKQIKSKKTRPVNEGEAPQKQTVKEEEGNGSDQIVPRVMMLFAGLVTVSKILKRSS